MRKLRLAALKRLSALQISDRKIDILQSVRFAQWTNSASDGCMPERTKSRRLAILMRRTALSHISPITTPMFSLNIWQVLTGPSCAGNGNNLVGNRHDRSGGSEIVLDILYYLCSYKLTATIRQKPSYKKMNRITKNPISCQKCQKSDC